MDVFTSIALNYLPKARLLASSVKKKHPDWTFHLCICDRMPADTPVDFSEALFDNIIWIEDLPIENLDGWIFKHSIVEICTAVKGTVIHQLLEQGAEKVIYLDPDIAVFNALTDIENLLDDYPIVLTPHNFNMEEELEAIADNEIGPLKHGVFNLGFVALNNTEEGLRFASWWKDRLIHFCYDDIPNGLFTDQKWCDLAPVFFENLHILRDPGANVASWNLSRRRLKISNEGVILVNNSPLKFFHFTGFDSGSGEIMTRKYASGNPVVYEIWNWYKAQLAKQDHDSVSQINWVFGTFQNGEKIPQIARDLYRHHPGIQATFPHPFDTSDDESFYSWFMAHTEEVGV